MNLFKRKTVILIVMWWLALLFPLILLCFGYILLAIYASVLSAFVRATLPYGVRKLKGFESFLYAGSFVSFLIYLFASGLARELVMTIQKGEHSIFLFGSACLIFVAIVLRDCRRFSDVSTDELDSYYNQ